MFPGPPDAWHPGSHPGARPRRTGRAAGRALSATLEGDEESKRLFLRPFDVERRGGGGRSGERAASH
eukprot:2103356-Pyramimonas_sp.AAC.1